MNILLLIPPAKLDVSYGELKDFSNPQPSIGLAYMASVLIENKYNVIVLDAYVQQLGIEQIMSEIRVREIDIIGISLLTTSVDITTDIVRKIRTNFPNIKIVMGNVHASIFSDEILNNNLADFIVHREGEYTFLNLVKAFSSNGDLTKIDGISFLDNGKIIHTEETGMIEDLDSLPFPAWHLFPLNLYKTDPRTEIIPGVSEMQILGTRGCPNACTFCSSRTEKSLGSKYRMRSAKNIVDEIQFMNERYGSRVFSFMDLAFPLVKKHALEVCQEIIDRGLHKKMFWTTECRVKPLDFETLQKMRESGCIRINFGIESGNNRILKLLKKNFTTEDVENAVALAAKAKIQVDGMFMMGLPTESRKEIIETINFALKLNLRYAIFNIFVPYPGCELYNTLSSQGKIRWNKWSDFTSYPTYSGSLPVYVPEELSHTELMELQKLAMHKFYLRPKFIFAEIRRFNFSKIRKYYNGLRTLIFKGI